VMTTLTPEKSNRSLKAMAVTLVAGTVRRNEGLIGRAAKGNGRTIEQ